MVRIQRSKRSSGPRRVTVAVGLGANLGDPRATFAAALRRLGAAISGLRVSPLYRTAPLGGPPQRDYLNAVAVGLTRAPAPELLALLKTLERRAGRRPSPRRNVPRRLDLDLLLYGRLRLSSPSLVLPHPRLHERLFVLRPLFDLLPDRIVPGLGLTVAEILARAPRSRVDRVSSPGWFSSPWAARPARGRAP